MFLEQSDIDIFCKIIDLISEELNSEFIPMDAKIRKIASDIYYIGSNETTLVMLIGLGSLIAYEFSQRIKNNNF